MEKKIEYAIAAVTTNKVFPKVFITEEEAEKFKSHRPDPLHWKVVSREVTYSEWKYFMERRITIYGKSRTKTC